MGLLPSLLWMILILGDLYFRPSLFFFHPAFGYFPGPLYDEWIPILPKVISFRLWTLGFSIGLLLLSRNKTRRHAIALLLPLLVVFLFRSHFGWSFSHKDIRNKLGNELTIYPMTLYYSNRSFSTEQKARRYLRSLSYYLHEITTELDLDIRSIEPMAIYVYPDANIKQFLTGTRYTAVGHPLQRSVHIVKEPVYQSLLPHELTHIVSAAFGPKPFNINFNVTILEGLATAIEGKQGSLSVHEWARAMIHFKTLPNLKHLLGSTAFFSEAPKKAYLASGSFCKWLLDTKGASLFKEYYQTNNFEKVYHETMAGMIDKWIQFLKLRPLTNLQLRSAETSLKQKPVFSRSCPHDVADMYQHFLRCDDQKLCQSEALAKAYIFSNDDPSIGLHLAKQYLSSSQLDCAQQLTMTLLENKTMTDSQQFQAKLLSADIWFLNGNFKRAKKQYDALKSDQNNVFVDSLDLRTKLITLDRATLREILSSRESQTSWMFYHPDFFFSSLSTLSVHGDNYLKLLKNFDLILSKNIHKPRDFETSIHIARIYEILGQNEKALKFYEEALIKAPTEGFRIQIERDQNRLRFVNQTL